MTEKVTAEKKDGERNKPKEWKIGRNGFTR